MWQNKYILANNNGSRDVIFIRLYKKITTFEHFINEYKQKCKITDNKKENTVISTF